MKPVAHIARGSSFQTGISARGRVRLQLSRLLEELRELEQAQVFEAFSRWRYGGFLDGIARSVSRHLQQLKSPIAAGCSFFYREAENRFVLGGSSTERWKMEHAARFYDVSNDADCHSFTAYALRFVQPLAFDDFHAARTRFSDRVNHTFKRCELPDTKTLSYVVIPHMTDSDTVEERLSSSLRSDDSLPVRDRAPDAGLPQFLMRLTYDKAGLARNTIRVLLSKEGRDVLNEIFRLVQEGYVAMQQHPDCGIAIADLNANLLRFTDAEYRGLGELACHLQSLFGECECSVFLAHSSPPTPSEPKKIRLYLAATSALNDSDQHRTFRRHFFDEKHHYTCAVGAVDPSVPLAKTEQAYLSAQPVRVANSRGTGLFRGKGEYQDSGSFMAVAIPGPPGELPYGVIRWVRQHAVPFTDGEERLARAIAKTLTYWTKFFPRNVHLQVRWSDERLHRDVLRMLFGLDAPSPARMTLDGANATAGAATSAGPPSPFAEADIEFSNLLGKIFCESESICIRRQFGGCSGSVVLLVSHDKGQDLVVKCGAKRKDQDEPNQIEMEVVRYREFVEGKLKPNHNLIYPRHVRETRNLNGFATTFLGGAPLAECASMKEPPERRFLAVQNAVDRLICDVWGWWYGKAQGPFRSTVPEFLKAAFSEGDRGWSLENDRLDALDSRVLDAMRTVLKVPFGQADPKPWLPSTLWTRFQQWACRSDATIEWWHTVTHGDPHGGNLFVNPTLDDVWIIDFARTARRVSIFDLAQLEAYVKLEFLPSVLQAQAPINAPAEFVKQFADCEWTLARQREYGTMSCPDIGRNEIDPLVVPALEGAYRVVRHLRCLAFDRLCRRGPVDDYLITLLVLSFWYLNARGVSGSVQSRSNLAVVMARESIDQLLQALALR